MIVRTSVLCACMIVVPGLALCSHHLPPGIRSAARAAVWQPVAGWFATAAAEPATSLPDEQEPPREPEPAGAAAGEHGVQGAATETDRLVALGAVAIECRPLAASEGMHVASCRVAMDAAGQLHRVFQAPGPTPALAMAALADQVSAWRERLAVRVGDRSTESVGR